jgi:hypothetical protein
MCVITTPNLINNVSEKFHWNTTWAFQDLELMHFDLCNPFLVKSIVGIFISWFWLVTFFCKVWVYFFVVEEWRFFKGVKTHYRGVTLGKKLYYYSFGTFCIILGVVFLWCYLGFWLTCKMDFDTKASNKILVIFQMKLIFQQTSFFQHSYVCLNKKPHQDVFCEITWMEVFIWNWNGTINSYSMYD